MKRDWKPGDVAMLTFADHHDDAIGVRTRDGFAHCGQFGAGSAYDGIGGFTARPLVVIDLGTEPLPHDGPKRTDGQLLVSVLRETAENFFTPDAAALAIKVADQIEGQVRSPKPPKPSEPLGLGAVVENDTGYKFVRVADHIDGWAAGAQWQRIGGELNAIRNFGWDKVAAVRVLSEGVQS